MKASTFAQTSSTNTMRKVQQEGVGCEEIVK
jgi:hypothetical protein